MNRPGRGLVELVVWMVWVCLMLAGCQSTYYAAMEKVGIHKRDIMVDRVEKARDAQLEAKEQFKSALEQFTATVAVKGGELEKVYKKLAAELERSEEKAEKVHSRIEDVEDVSEALFKEWEEELELYSNASLRRSSRQKLDQTRQRYAQLMRAMRRAESRIEPVLRPLRDQVLYLKHNLNAQAILALQNELVNIEGDVSDLIREMEISIAEADAFISNLEQG